MILPDVREAALEQVERALGEELGDDPLLRTRAESLVAIAIAEGIDVDDLIRWIHYRVPEKEWSLDEFRRWAKKLQETVQALTELQAAANCGQLCGNCFGSVAQRTSDGHWWCSHCGQIS